MAVGRRLLHLRQQLRVGRVHGRPAPAPRGSRSASALRGQLGALRPGVGQVERRHADPGRGRRPLRAPPRRSARALRAGRAGRLRRHRAELSRCAGRRPGGGHRRRTGAADRPRQRCRRSTRDELARLRPRPDRGARRHRRRVGDAWRRQLEAYAGRSSGSQGADRYARPSPSAEPRSRPVCRPPSWRPAPRSLTRWPRAGRRRQARPGAPHQAGRAAGVHARRARAAGAANDLPAWRDGGRGRGRAAGDRAGDRAAGGAPGRRRSFATAVAISREFFARPPAVYLATGSNFPDALSAVPAAGRLGAPLLLVQRDRLPPTVARRARAACSRRAATCPAAPPSSATSS